MEQHLAFASNAPYPPVQVLGPNARYAAAMLSNIGSCNSEMSAVSLYFYNSIILRPLEADMAESFHEISIVEMRHLDIFGRLASLLGADPRLWSCARGSRKEYWSPACNKYPQPPLALVQNALAGECAAIAQYRRQAGWIQDPYIVENLNRIIVDEECHVAIFRQMIERLCPPAAPTPKTSGGYPPPGP